MNPNHLSSYSWGTLPGKTIKADWCPRGHASTGRAAMPPAAPAARDSQPVDTSSRAPHLTLGPPRTYFDHRPTLGIRWRPRSPSSQRSSKISAMASEGDPPVSVPFENRRKLVPHNAAPRFRRGTRRKVEALVGSGRRGGSRTTTCPEVAWIARRSAQMATRSPPNLRVCSMRCLRTSCTMGSFMIHSPGVPRGNIFRDTHTIRSRQSAGPSCA